uniref:26S proteasome non-ATPase regulatory subunit 5 n=1 Tax=Phallusia mammillata TaxID=59560 RepID=A0A6F9DP83_9ASCI|nr:26S proteasome non-ATPase regulatory subunit 5 [Phallusia mammillata]
MASVQSITRLMEKLSISSERPQTLVEMKSFVTSVPSSTLKNVVKANDLLALFECINTENKEQIENTCFILSILLPIVDPFEIITYLSASLQVGLEHPNQEVKLLALKELNHIISTPEGARALCESPEIVKLVIKLVAEDEELIALAAVRFLSDYGSISPMAARMMLAEGTDSNLNDLKEAMQKNSVVRYRVYEIICDIQSQSEEMLNLCLDTGIIADLVKELLGDDVLSMVTCCAMLANMASSQHSFNYLVQSGVVSKMTELLKDSQENPLSSLYIPGVIRFFGNLCLYNGPKVVVDIYPVFCHILFDLIKSSEQSKKLVAMETIGVVGESFEGKSLLYDQGKRCTEAVKEICHVMCHGSEDLRFRAVRTMRQLLTPSKENEDQTDQINDITVSWFQQISLDPVDTIIGLCKQPFTDIRCSGFRLLQTVAECNWGLPALVEVPTLTEFLLDRSTETEKPCKEAKFDVVKTIAMAPSSASIFGNQNYLRFRHFVNEGPFYVEASLSVAIEDA